MAHVEKSIEVHVPLQTAYDQWTQFEEFPKFMEGVKQVRQLDDKRLHWVADLYGIHEEWDAEITSQHPDQGVAWRSTSGAHNAGNVSFAAVDPNTTRVTLRIDYDPERFVEKVGDKLGLVSRRVEGDLKNFKDFIEARGKETGAWRGTIEGEQVNK